MGPNPDLPLDCQTYTELVTVVDTCETEKNTRGKTKIIFKMFKWSKNDLINKKHTKQQKSTIILIPRSSTLYDILLVNTKWSWFFDNVLPLCYFFPKMIIYIYTTSFLFDNDFFVTQLLLDILEEAFVI